MEVTEVVKGLHRPTFITSPRDGTQRLFVTEQTGTIRVIDADGQLLEAPLLDISAKITKIDPLCCDERGLLSVVTAPNFTETKRFYVYYTGDRNEIFISRFHISSDDPNRADPGSEEVVLRFEHQYENHFAGQLAFNRIDGKLYFSIGDGAGGGNPLRSAQNPDSPYGKVWRFDAEGGATDLELYSLGLRNPWRFSFDRLNGDMYLGDVGEDSFEEVNYQPHDTVGANFGWSVFEGPHCFEEADCSQDGLTLPAISYSHDIGCSVTSGYVYRGSETVALQGVYLYGDFCYGKIWGASRSESGEWQNQLLLDENPHNWSAFGEDEAGEIYGLDYLPGSVYRVRAVVDQPAEAETKKSGVSRSAP